MRKYKQVFSMGFLVTLLRPATCFAGSASSSDLSCASISRSTLIRIKFACNYAQGFHHLRPCNAGDENKLVKLLKPFGSVMSGLTTGLVLALMKKLAVFFFRVVNTVNRSKTGIHQKVCFYFHCLQIHCRSIC